MEALIGLNGVRMSLVPQGDTCVGHRSRLRCFSSGRFVLDFPVSPSLFKIGNSGV